MAKDASYFRARLAVIEEQVSKVEADRSEKNNDRVVFRNGVFPKGFNERKLVDEKASKESFSKSPLSFLELTRFNTWFAQNPEKVAGKELISTSREFPVTIKGTKEDIIRVLGGKNQLKFQLALKMKRAKAKLKIMKL